MRSQVICRLGHTQVFDPVWDKVFAQLFCQSHAFNGMSMLDRRLGSGIWPRKEEMRRGANILRIRTRLYTTDRGSITRLLSSSSSISTGRVPLRRPYTTAQESTSGSTLSPLAAESPSAESSANSSASNATLELRDYQKDCIRNCLTAFADGKRRIGVSLATGGGKTVIFSHLVGETIPVQGQGNQTLILAHRKELVMQAATHCKRAHPDKSVEIEMGIQKASGKADITVGSVMSVSRPSRLEKFDPKDFKLLIIDEAHHAAATTYQRVLEHFGAVDSSSKVQVAGFSATLARHDGLRLGTAMDHIVYDRGFVDMINSGWLCDMHFTTVKTNVNLNDVKTTNRGDYDVEDLSKHVNTSSLNELVYKTWSHYSRNTQNNYKSTLIFCVNIEHVENLSKLFQQHGVDAQYVTSRTAPDVRTSIVEDFRNGKFPVLLNCGIFTEGTDIPNIDFVILNRPTKSRNLYIQMIGRGMRLHHGKDHCHVIDLVGTVDNGVITVPSLAGLDPAEVVHRKTFPDMQAKAEVQQSVELGLIQKKKQKELDLLNSMVTLETFEGIAEFIDQNQFKVNTPVPILTSRYNWVRIDRDAYVLTAPGGYLLLESYESRTKKSDKSKPVRTLYRLSHCFRIESAGNSKHKGPTLVKNVKFDDIDYPQSALAASDSYASSAYPVHLILKNASWRSQPITQQQESRIIKMFERLKRQKSFTLDKDFMNELNNLKWIKTMSKGEATDFLTKSNFKGGANFLRSVLKARIAKARIPKLERPEKGPKRPLFLFKVSAPVKHVSK